VPARHWPGDNRRRGRLGNRVRSRGRGLWLSAGDPQSPGGFRWKERWGPHIPLWGPNEPTPTEPIPDWLNCSWGTEICGSGSPASIYGLKYSNGNIAHGKRESEHILPATRTNRYCPSGRTLAGSVGPQHPPPAFPLLRGVPSSIPTHEGACSTEVKNEVRIVERCREKVW